MSFEIITGAANFEFIKLCTALDVEEATKDGWTFIGMNPGLVTPLFVLGKTRPSLAEEADAAAKKDIAERLNKILYVMWGKSTKEQKEEARIALLDIIGALRGDEG